MQVSVEKTSELSRKMTVSLPDNVLQEKMDSRLKKLAREVKIDGFRPGKVPANVVKKMYGERVRNEVAGDLIQSTYFEALQQQELVPAGHPNIVPSGEGEGFEYTAEFEVYPEVCLTAVNDLEITRPTASVTDADVEKMIEKLRQQKKTWTLVERASQEGDQVTIHFSGVSEGENFTDGKVENYVIQIGAKQMIPGFEDQLIGLTVGAQKTFTVSFPEKYNSEKLAGKEAQFEIELIKVEQPVLPDLDAEFIKAYGVEDGDVNGFYADVRVNMERELAQGLKEKVKMAVLDALNDNVQLTLPNALIDQEIKVLMKPYEERAKKDQLNMESLNLPRDIFENKAKRRVALGLILGEIVKQNEIKVDADKVRVAIENIARSYERPEEVVSWYYEDPSRVNDIQQLVLEEQAIDWVIEQAKVVDQTVEFDDVMSQPRA